MKVPSPFRKIARGFMPILLWTLVLQPASSRAAAERPIFEVQGQFVHATKAQLNEALDAAHVDHSTTVLTPEQFQTVRTKLKDDGAVTFSEPRAITQGGQLALVQMVREIRFPAKYEPSQKEPGKSVPTQFETRNAGVTLKAEPGMNANGSLYIAAAPTYTQFLGFIDYSSAKPAAKDGNATPLEDLLKAPLSAGGIWQPVFATFTVSSSFDLQDGQTVIMGGPVATEAVTAPAGQSAAKSTAPPPEVLVFLTVKKVVRE